MPVDKASVQALKNILSEIDILISTSLWPNTTAGAMCVPMPQNRTPRCLELTRIAMVLTDDILTQDGINHYRKMAYARKTHAGGRPRKQTELIQTDRNSPDAPASR